MPRCGDSSLRKDGRCFQAAGGGANSDDWEANSHILGRDRRL